jgi:hypothetical protein
LSTKNHLKFGGRGGGEKAEKKKREMRLKNVSLDVNEADKENNNQLTNYVINSFFFTLLTRFLSVRLFTSVSLP